MSNPTTTRVPAIATPSVFLRGVPSTPSRPQGLVLASEARWQSALAAPECLQEFPFEPRARRTLRAPLTAAVAVLAVVAAYLSTSSATTSPASQPGHSELKTALDMREPARLDALHVAAIEPVESTVAVAPPSGAPSSLPPPIVIASIPAPAPAAVVKRAAEAPVSRPKPPLPPRRPKKPKSIAPPPSQPSLVARTSNLAAALR